MENMKLYKDGTTLYIVIENPSENLEGILINMLGNMNKVREVEADEPKPEPVPDLSNAREVKMPARKITEEKKTEQKEESDNRLPIMDAQEDVIKTPKPDVEDKILQVNLKADEEEKQEDPQLPKVEEQKKSITEMNDEELRLYLNKNARTRKLQVYLKSKYDVTSGVRIFIRSASHDILLDLAKAI